MIYSWVGLAVALFLFWYPTWDDDRRRMRRNEHEAEAKRLDIYLQHGIDVRCVEFEHLDEWLHWQRHGRGVSYR